VDARGLIPSDINGNFAPPDAFGFMTMLNLAAQTGGQAFFNTNDIGGAIRLAIDDSRVTYELGFYPSTTKWDGSFHTLKVKVNRPAAHVRTRKGYLALPEPKMTPETRQSMVSQATVRLLQDHGIDLTVHVDAADSSEENSRTLNLSLVMDPHQLGLKSQDGRWAGVVDLLFYQLDDQHRIIHSRKQPYQLNLLPATYERPPAHAYPGRSRPAERRATPSDSPRELDRSGGCGWRAARYVFSGPFECDELNVTTSKGNRPRAKRF